MRLKSSRICYLLGTLLVSGVLFLSVCFQPTKASSLTFEFDFVISGESPKGSTPWLTAEIMDIDKDTVRLTMTAANLSSILGHDEYVSDWLFNLDPSLDRKNLNFTYVSGIEAQSILQDPGPDDYTANGDGNFDIQFIFNPEQKFTIASTSVYEVSLIGLTASSFDFLSETGDGEGIYRSAAHVQNIVRDEGDYREGWIGDETPVPEPATLLLLGSGLIGLAGLARRKLKK